MARDARHRGEKKYTRLYRLVGGLSTLAFTFSLVIALLPQVPLLAAAQQETFQHWLNDNGDWATGAINAQNSTYAEGDVIPHWIEWANTTAGNSETFSFSYEWQDSSGNTGHDYLDDVNETETATLVGGLSSIAIPADPEVGTQLGAQPSGQFLYSGFTVDSVSLHNFDHGDREDKYYTFTVTFTDTAAHLYYGAHLARDSQWPAGGASSFSGGNLENRFDRDGIGIGSSADQTRSIQVGAIGPEPSSSIVVQKVTVGGTGTFGFSSGTLSPSPFELVTVAENSAVGRTFAELAAGTYDVAEALSGAQLAAGWSLTSAVCDDQSPPSAISLAAGETVTCTFTNTWSTTTTTTTTTTVQSLGSIGDFVWDDGVITEANGIQNAGEPGVAGVTVNLYDGSGVAKLASQITGSDGKYLFTGLPAGSYLVEFVIPVGIGLSFVNGHPGGPDAADSDADPVSGRSGVVTLGVGQNDLSWDAGLTKPAVLPQVITTTTSTPPETLPFTGSSERGVGGIGVALLILGSTLLLVMRRREDESQVISGWSARLERGES
jgi:hypothetical protein